MFVVFDKESVEFSNSECIDIFAMSGAQKFPISIMKLTLRLTQPLPRTAPLLPNLLMVQEKFSFELIIDRNTRVMVVSLLADGVSK